MAVCLLALLGGRMAWADNGQAAPPRPPPANPEAGFVILQNFAVNPAIRRGDAALAARIVTVVEKPESSPTGNPHDYVSYAIYYWPDSARPGGRPFVSRDGHRNELQIARGDAPRFSRFLAEVETLAIAWKITGRPAFARRAGDWLRAWMVDPATRMTPNLEHAQIRLGRDGNEGAPGGIIDAANLPKLIEALQLLEGSPALPAADANAVRGWLGDYYVWLTTSRHGRKERASRNNHGVWYLDQAASIALFLGRDHDARGFLREARRRIGAQVEPDGAQPEEIKRADGFSYSVYDLDAFFGLALLGERAGVDLWHYQAPNGGSLRKALDYLLPYGGAVRRPWPGRQLRPITGRELDFARSEANRIWPGADYDRPPGQS